MSADIKSLRIKRQQQSSANKLVAVIESELDAVMAGPDPGLTMVAVANGFVGQLAGALCATIDYANDHSSGVASPAFMRDFLRHVATQLEEQGADHRANNSHVAAGCCAVTVQEMRECADRLDEYADSARTMLMVARGEQKP